MNFKQKTSLALAALALTASNLVAAQTTLLNASYDVAREFYKDINVAFAANYKKTTGKDIKIDQAHGGSSAQARAVNDGLATVDVVYLTGGSSALQPLVTALQNAMPQATLVSGNRFGGVAAGLAYAGSCA